MQPWQKNFDSWIRDKVPTLGQNPSADQVNYPTFSEAGHHGDRNDDDDNDGGGGKPFYQCNSNKERFFPLHHGAITYVPYKEIVTVGVIGTGRNGACFKVKWNGREYAMKQFDIGRCGDKYFERELQAYMMLQDVWGILVPRPIFLSESCTGGVMFLGLQLGRESTNANDVKKFDDVLLRLRNDYGIRHNDADFRRNMIIITDTDGNERVAAIDFEDWDHVSKPVKQERLRV
jgi:hypothetical protein